MSKRKVHFLLSLIVVAIFLAISSRQEAQNRSGLSQDDATPVQAGVMTDRERQHAKLYVGYGMRTKIIEMLGSQDEVSLVRNKGLIGSESDTPVPTLQSFVQGMACRSDAVVTGRITKRSSQLTDDGTFVFTDYTVEIGLIIKDDRSRPFNPRASILVSRPGGKVRLAGHLVVAIDESAKLLQVGSSYLFFLKQTPGSQDYYALDGTSAIAADTDTIDKLWDESPGNLLAGAGIGSIGKTVKSTSCSQ